MDIDFRVDCSFQFDYLFIFFVCLLKPDTAIDTGVIIIEFNYLSFEIRFLNHDPFYRVMIRRAGAGKQRVTTTMGKKSVLCMQK